MLYSRRTNRIGEQLMSYHDDLNQFTYCGKCEQLFPTNELVDHEEYELICKECLLELGEEFEI